MAMEAAPRLPMLSFDLKTANTPPKLAPKLKKYIGECYREDPESYNNEIQQLEGLRAMAVLRPSIDASGAAVLKRYFCQLRRLKSRFPMSTGQPVAVSFAWKDLFADVVCTMADIRFEMDCVLYNIGALHSKLGAAESRTDPDSMKSACTHFQIAVWTFQHLKDHYPRPSGVDLSPEIIKLFQDICLAQAQECILEKSMQDSRKPVIVGAIGMQTIQHYKSALSALEYSHSADSLRETVGLKTCNMWNKYLSFKIAYISSIIYLFQGMQSEESQKMGERVAYYQLASDKLQEAKKLSKGMAQIEAINEAITFTNDVVEGKRKAAKNENEFIYHEEVPDKELLNEPKPAALAKGIPINFNDPEVSGPDIFSRLVPMRAHEASSMYSEEKAMLLRKVTGDVEAKDLQLNDFMSSLQLDELNVLNEPERLPQDLIDICASLSVKTDAIQNLIETMNNLADIHTEVESMFSEIKNLIETEERSEKDFQQVIGKRPPSIVSTELSREANKYLEAHNKANESNQTLHKAMTLHLANLKLLCLPLDELTKHIPSLESIKGNIDTVSMSDMRSLVEKVNAMRAQRSMIVLLLREAVNADDITSQLLTRTGESLDEIFKQEIEKHNKNVNLLNQNMLAQENILKALTEAYAKYAPTKKIISDVIKKKESFLTAMKTSYETYEDLLNKSLKGIEFYRKLSSTVSRLLTRLKSTCKVQQEERAQLLTSHSSKTTVTQIPKSSPTAIGATINIAKEEISSGPKLKDYLPYMKNRNNMPQPLATEVADTSYSGHLYPPYVRPAPLGSEEKNEPVSYNYGDTTYNTTIPKMPDSEIYKQVDYQNSFVNPELNPYTINPVNVEQYNTGDPKIYPQYSDYYPYNATNLTGDISKVIPNETNFNTIAGTVSGTTTSLSHYDQNASTPQQYTSTNNYNFYGTNYDQTAVNQKYPNIYNQNQVNYPINTQSPYVEPNQIDYSGMVDQMQNMNINNQVSNANITNQPQNASIPSQIPNVNIPNQIQTSVSSYGVINPHLTNTQQVYDPTIQYSSNNPYLTNTYPNLSIQQMGDNTSINTMSYTMTQMPPVPNISIPNSVNADGSTFTMYSAVETNLSNSYPAPIVSSTSNPNQTLQNPYYPQVSSADPNMMPYAADTKSSTDGLISSHTSTYPSVPQATLPHQAFPTSQQSVVPPVDELRSGSGSFSPNIQPDADLPIQSHVQLEFLPKNVPSISSHLNYNINSPMSLPDVLGTSTENKEAHPTNYIYNTNDTSNITAYQTNTLAYGYDNTTGLYGYNTEYQNYHMMQQNNEVLPENQYQNLQPNSGYYNQNQTVPIQNSTLPTTEQNPNISNTEIPVQYSMPYNPYQNIDINAEQTVVEQPKDSTNYNDSVKSEDTSNVVPNEGKPAENVTNVTNDVKKTEKEPSSLDLLSGLDFNIEQTPLMPEIRVPPVSEHVIRKVPVKDVSETIDQDTNEEFEDKIISRPQKRDIFADPILLNKFTQEVKSLQQVVDGFTKKTHSGITMLDSKWKKIQDTQNKENHLKGVADAKNNLDKNMSPDVITYDDSRVKLTSDYSNEYINASHIKQISSWSIPMIVSDLPREVGFNLFWHMIFQQNIDLIVCLVTEIELQGNFYVPTSKNQVLEFSGLKITLDEMLCNVNWTERKLIIKYKNVERKISHYQINVFPARVVSAPLVMLVDKILKTKDSESDELPKALIHCNTGAGRSALIILLTMAICQVRAGFVDLRDMLDSGLLYLCGVRTNVLEDTKYLVDIYRTVLFYVQGVLCSGTVMFNGEAVSVQTGASVPPPAIVNNPRKTDNFNKFTKESFEEMKQAAGLKSGDMQDPLSYLDPMWSLKKRKD